VFFVSGLALPAAGATTQPLDIKLQSISIVRARTFLPLSDRDSEEEPSTGTNVALLIAPTTGQCIRALRGLALEAVVDDRNTVLYSPAGAKPVPASGRMQMQNGGSYLMSRRAGLIYDFAFDRPVVSGVLRLNLGFPSPEARVLRHFAGSLQGSLSRSETLSLQDLKAKIGQSLVLGANREATLKLTVLKAGFTQLIVTGTVANLGEFQFYGPDNNELRAKTETSFGDLFPGGPDRLAMVESLLSSFFGSAPSGPPQNEMKFTFYSATEPTSLAVTVFQSPTAVTIPFVFDNIHLPQP
jgi:hypothetical protein